MQSRSILHYFFYLFLVGCLLIPLDSSAQDFYDLYSVKEIRLEFKQDNWADILSKFKDQGQKKRVTATLKLNGVTYDSVGVRYKGNSSYYSVKRGGQTKLPFNIKLNHKIKGQKMPGKYNTIKLSNVFRAVSYTHLTLPTIYSV